MPEDERYPGLGKRIGLRILTLGYRNEAGKPDVPRWAREHDWDKTAIYAYVNSGRVAGYNNLLRLARDLQMPVAFLLLGVEGIKELRQYERTRSPEALKGERRSLLDNLLMCPKKGGEER